MDKWEGEMLFLDSDVKAYVTAFYTPKLHKGLGDFCGHGKITENIEHLGDGDYLKTNIGPIIITHLCVNNGEFDFIGNGEHLLPLE